MRARLTLLYTGLFLVTSTILLTVTNLLLGKMLNNKVGGLARLGPAPVIASQPPAPGDEAPAAPGGTFARDVKVSHLPSVILHYQWTITAIAIAVLAAVSAAAGWWLAGRMLRPLRHITATAHRLSVSNLHERIALDGPRDELKDLADTFDAMLGRLERSVDSQRRFIANAAHELRTPLSTQRAAIQIGLDDPLPDHLVQVRDKLLVATRRTERLIDSLLILAQAEHGLDTTEPVDLETAVRQAVHETIPSAIAANVQTRPVTVDGDPVLLTRLVTNLLQNAVRYNRPQGRVDVDLTSTGALTIRNTGPDVPPERINELFQPFRRLHTRTRTDGSGLGLSIVASIARAHHATVTARPLSGGGLELTVAFQDPADRVGLIVLSEPGHRVPPP
ncbi:sensor histidine kinase [Actinomadura nitritigenes]|uniref:sensor histidine kinase n=1 Tax=Actinomadura nitritigenes TaxID=134602 RepID=UPI003D93E96E